MMAESRCDREATIRADGWLSTGDLGYLADGKLFVVGRRKQVIKRAGSSIDVGSIESATRTLEVLRTRPVAIFGAFDDARGAEQLVVQTESPRISAREHDLLRAELARTIREVTGIAPDVVEFVASGEIPRTTSGKIQHGAAREKYLQRTLQAGRETAT